MPVFGVFIWPRAAALEPNQNICGIVIPTAVCPEFGESNPTFKVPSSRTAMAMRVDQSEILFYEERFAQLIAADKGF